MELLVTKASVLSLLSGTDCENARKRQIEWIIRLFRKDVTSVPYFNMGCQLQAS